MQACGMPRLTRWPRWERSQHRRWGKDTKDGPYDKLKKALRAEIDEGEWSKLYSATSQPFDPPNSGKIAVKVINHFGDEVLKVYPVPAPGKAK